MHGPLNVKYEADYFSVLSSYWSEINAVYFEAFQMYYSNVQ